MKHLLKKLLPSSFIARLIVLRPNHRRWLVKNEEEKVEVARLQAEHEAHNRQAASDEIILHGQRLKVHEASRVAFEYFSFRSPDMVREMGVFLEHTRPCRRLLDIGALHGIFSLLFVQSSAARAAVAVDASPVASARLDHNVAVNGLAGRIVTRQLALSDREGTLQMRYDWEHAIATTAVDSSDKLIAVSMTTGDSVCMSLSFNPDAIKIDVEGHETKVLRGLKKIITAHRPLLFLEVHPQLIVESGDAGADVLEYLAALGYTAITIKNELTPLHGLFSHDARFLLRAPRA